MRWETVTGLLREVLEEAMQDAAFDDCRLVGGTALSLQIGHRESVDIDLFTDVPYGSFAIDPVREHFHQRYPYVDSHAGNLMGPGLSYFVGHSPDELVKVDIYYTDPFIRPVIEEDGIRVADMEDILAMKMDVIGRGGRKKDFWDLHAMHDSHSISGMLAVYRERFPYGHEYDELRASLLNFSIADEEPDPICLLGKEWGMIKLDFHYWVNAHE